MGDFIAVPLFLPAIGAWAVVAVLAARAIGRGLGTSSLHGGALVLAFGLVTAATLTPQWAALAHGEVGPATCDVSRLGLAPLGDYLRVGDISGNVLMFIPLGLTVALLPRSRERTVLIITAAILPLAIESTQLMLGFLDRACQSGDVIDNGLGLLLGLAAGATMRAWAGIGRRGNS